MPSNAPLRGRQAEAARNDQLVLEAAREVFAQGGFDAPITAVAERAGVGVATLYRRYGSKEELLRHLCLTSMRQNLDAVRRALANPEAGAALTEYVRECVGFSAGAFAGVAGKLEPTESMWTLAGEVHAGLATLTERAHAVGALRADASAGDVVWLIELYGRAFAGPLTAERQAVRERQLALSLTGLRATGDQPLPGTSPQLSDYQYRWRSGAGDGSGRAVRKGRSS